MSASKQAIINTFEKELNKLSPEALQKKLQEENKILADKRKVMLDMRKQFGTGSEPGRRAFKEFWAQQEKVDAILKKLGSNSRPHLKREPASASATASASVSAATASASAASVSTPSAPTASATAATASYSSSAAAPTLIKNDYYTQLKEKADLIFAIQNSENSNATEARQFDHAKQMITQAFRIADFLRNLIQSRADITSFNTLPANSTSGSAGAPAIYSPFSIPAANVPNNNGATKSSVSAARK